MPSGLTAIFGGRPKVPIWQNINLTGVGGQQDAAIAGNAQALPGLESLATGVDTFNQDQITQLLNNVMPGFSASSATAGANIQSELSGKIPTDVADTVQSSAAAQALTGGFGGSGLAGNLTAKDLGLTSLDLTNQGMSSLESWSANLDKMFAPGEFNVSSMFVDPQTEFQDTMNNQEMAWGQQWESNQVAAMPNPAAAGLFKYLSGLQSGVMSIFGGAMGGGA
jgi:hypothetical protein